MVHILNSNKHVTRTHDKYMTPELDYLYNAADMFNNINIHED